MTRQSSYYSIFPEKNVGGFSRADVTLIFYAFLGSVVQPEHTVVDLGAGRGAQFESQQNHFVRQLRTLKGRCARLIGVDVDPAVLQNEFLDQAFVIAPSDRMPFEDESVDVIYADWVLEHVENPAAFAAELYRVLKPGGWFCARTPNKWGIIGLCGRVVPNSLHAKFLSRLQPDRKNIDVFPTYHRMNSIGAIRKAFQADQWENRSFVHGFEIAYFNAIPLLAWLGYLYNKLLPNRLGLVVLAFLQKIPC